MENGVILAGKELDMTGTYTENYNLYKPDIGETGWGNFVNINFDTIDAALSSGSGSSGSSSGSGSGVTDAVYILGKAHSSLSDAIAIPTFVDHPDIPPSVPSAYDDEFTESYIEFNLQWDPRGEGELTSYDVNTTLKNRLRLEHPGTVADYWTYFVQTIPEGEFDMRAKVSWGGKLADYTKVGIVIARDYDAEEVDIMPAVILYTGYDDGTKIMVQKYTDQETWADNYATRDVTTNSCYLRIMTDGVDYWKFYYSFDGLAWVQLIQQAYQGALGFEPDVIGIAMLRRNSAGSGYDDSVGIIEWFRVY